MSVHFPIALIVVGIYYNFTKIYKTKSLTITSTGILLHLLGTISAVVACLTGEYFTHEHTGKAHDIKEIHELFANLTMYLMVTISILFLWIRYKKVENNTINIIILLLMGASLVSVAIAGYYGGTLVYNYMIQ
ncbi:MAG: hypothetical protein A2W98_14900 [Bacteroidetes bacterium GWF2_33_38]|nr:MAG: hypothetical protein A2W98_14900 [Bacteroidetes bacterium GWF2_33_38]